MRSRIAVVAAVFALAGTPALLHAEPLGQVLTLPQRPGPHWVWLADLVLRRSALIDAGDGRFLGSVSAGLGTIALEFAPERDELYLAETHYARGTRGERTDVVTVYDAVSLEPTGEIQIPAKRAEHFSGVASSALSDDGRFLAIFNFTPALSLSIVDVEARRFTAELETPGCSLVYAAGPRRFAMLCGDGSLLTLTLDAAGQEVGRERSGAFFDPQSDPVTEKASRLGDRWQFVSFEGWVHPVDVSGPRIRFEEKWSLFTEAERGARWRIGGTQHLAGHQASGRLFALVHQGGPDTHKDPGLEVWVYDVERRARVGRIALENPLAVFVEQSLGVDRAALTGRVVGWLLRTLLPNPGVDRIQVTQDADPVLVAVSNQPATLIVYDAQSGGYVRDVPEVGIAAGLLQAP